MRRSGIVALVTAAFAAACGGSSRGGGGASVSGAGGPSSGGAPAQGAPGAAADGGSVTGAGAGSPPAAGQGAPTGNAPFDASAFVAPITNRSVAVSDLGPSPRISCVARAPGFDALGDGPRFAGPVPCSQGFCVESAPSAGPIRTLAGVSSSALWAVGEGVLLRFDGARWDTACAPLDGLDLWSSHAAAPDDVWIAGTHSLAHYDGARWSATPSPLAQQVPAIWGNARQAFALDFAGTIATWSGARWDATFSTPYVGGPWSLWGDTLGHAWSVDAGLRSWDGAAWPELQRPRLGSQIFDVEAVWAPVGGAAWAGGFTYRDPEWRIHDAAVASLVDGAWVANPLPPGSWEVKWIRGSGPADVWVGATSADDQGGGMLRWDGGAWTRLPGPLPPPALPPLVLSPTEAWVSTSTWDPSGRTVYGIDRFDGAAWSSSLRLTGPAIGALSGNGPRDVWAIGDGRDVWRYDGVAWQRVRSAFGGRLSAVATTATDAWFAGTRDDATGAALHWDGSRFEETTFPTRASRVTARAREAWVASDGDPTAGTSAVVHRFDGATWVDLDTGAALVVDGLWSGGPTDLWVVGAISRPFTPPVTGVILHHDGARWDRRDLPGYAVLDVWGAGPDDVWVSAETASCGKCPPVPYAAMLLHWDGHGFTQVADVAPASLTGTGAADVWGTTYAWAPGASEPETSVYHFDGASWARAARLTTPFRAAHLAALPGGELWGTDGQRVIRRRAP